MITEVGHCRASLSFNSLNKVLIFSICVSFYLHPWLKCMGESFCWSMESLSCESRCYLTFFLKFFFIFLCAECRMSPNSTLRALDQWRFMSSCVFRHIPHTSHQGRILYSRFHKIATICLLPSFNHLLHTWTGSSIKQPTSN